MFHFGEPWWQIAVRVLIIYVAFLLALRFFGKREIGQFTLADLVLILLVANAVQPAMTGPDLSVGGGLLIIATLFAANFAVAYLRVHNRRVRALLQGHPTVIAQNGQWYPAAMRQQGVDEEDAMMALREHGLDKVADVELAVLEVDGSISVVPTEGSTLRRGRRRVRTRTPQG
jgi:uncharacterized membrane protein YcaP (DUF421 family)